jgi:hypothetical protein
LWDFKVLQRPPPGEDDDRAKQRRRRRREQKTASARRGRRGEYLLRGLLVTKFIRARMVKLGHILPHEADDREVVERTLVELVMRDLLHL